MASFAEVLKISFIQSHVVFLEETDHPWFSTSMGNPIPALGESISFGRFMTENLDWEKWSTFTQNRYVEEAERYSKPGSVAAKKAYFEAHYKRKAAERAAALIQEANANLQANGTFELEAQQRNHADSSSETSSSVQHVVAANEQPDEETVNCQVVECADGDQRKCDAGQSDLDISNVEGVVVDVAHPLVNANINLGSFTTMDNSNQFDHVEDNTNTGPVEEKMLEHGAAGPEGKREANSSPELSTKTVSSKCFPLDERKVAAASVSSRSGINSGPKGKKSVGDFVEKNKLIAHSVHSSINLSSGTGETRKRAAAAIQSRNGLSTFSTNKKSVGGMVEKKRIGSPLLKMSINLPSGAVMPNNTATAATKPRNGTNFIAKVIKSVGNSVGKRPTSRSLHMSINLPSGAAETSKTASVFDQNIIKKVHSNLPKNNPLAMRASTEASRGLQDQGSANLLSQSGRTERLLNKSVSGGVTVNAKPSSSISFGFLKSSSTNKSNLQSATVYLPFKFRSEERAVKRREFLQRMDETKSKEEEKVKLQRTLKGKTVLDHKKLGQSSASLSKQNEDKIGGSRSPSNRIRKTSPTLPRSPKLVRKASSSSSTVQDKSLGNASKPPISTNNSKPTTEKINRTTRPVNSLSSTTRENASPNIQH
ncbi:protein WVD2-like 7 isoform X1 [Vigna unguiculata]|uniref:protein WVD2-like 7 isoform X1 n=1 Tax=Vigna unguiculata TaxID=3917 RepID=UPI001016E539|nr:protein WVD2-like 7 isoform X1 [Vigna unguiculata]